MSVIIRLQGLTPMADSFDIRQFFCGLNIPRGGVYITGGKYGEAFIIFTSYEEARCALNLSGRLLKNSYVHLACSNETELQRALEIYRLGPNEPVNSFYYPAITARAPILNYLDKPSYLYIHGMPSRATKVEIREFFRGLVVADVLFMRFVSGFRNGNGIVKFAKSTDAIDGMKYNNLCLCGSPISLKLADEDEWMKNGGDKIVTRERSPSRRSSYDRRRSRSRSPGYRRERRGSPYIREFYVHLINLSYSTEKRELKKFFFNLDMSDSQITFLLDKDGRRTREGFSMFTTQKDYKRALSLHNEKFKGRTLSIFAISRRSMKTLIERMKKRSAKDHPEHKKSKDKEGAKRCIYLRNFASDVAKTDVQKFFTDFSVKEDAISLLKDNKGNGLGEALVKFSDEKEASKAEKLNHQKYLGTEILLSRITEGQMKALIDGTSESHSKKSNKKPSNADESLVSQADDVPDVTDGTVSKENSSSVQPSNDSNKTPVLKKQGETELDSEKAIGEAKDIKDSEPDNAQTMPMESSSPLDESEAMEECPNETDLKDADDENGLEEDPSSEIEEAGKSVVTLVFIRNLPATVTSEEMLDFFVGYKVSSVNLNNIERGIATVRMPSYAEAVSAIDALNKKEVGLKQVYLSLI